ncbi:hypothetical protein AHiyo8_42020 [Arthrobacter sp. Hiyo8]|nr:hypothetical protein AHiyo8_42020 [Arthrobacter sp. Hiyo8]
MVESAVALVDSGGDELCDDGAERDCDVGFAGCGGDDAEVLVVEGKAEAGSKLRSSIFWPFWSRTLEPAKPPPRTLRAASVSTP